jgi:hypothetical protein
MEQSFLVPFTDSSRSDFLPYDTNTWFTVHGVFRRLEFEQDLVLFGSLAHLAPALHATFPTPIERQHHDRNTMDIERRGCI